MNYQEAIVILESLANGVDPLTGEILPDDHICQRPQTIRALFLAVKALHQSSSPGSKQAAATQSVLPSNAGKPWKPDEDDLLSARFEQGLSIQEIAHLHQRTRGAITSRLVRLGKIEARDQADAAVTANRQK
jgi:hypothetical protein